MKLPDLLIVIFVAAGALAAPPIAVPPKHGLHLSLGIALCCIATRFGLVEWRSRRLRLSRGPPATRDKPHGNAAVSGLLWVGRDEDAASYRNVLAEAQSKAVPVIHVLEASASIGLACA